MPTRPPGTPTVDLTAAGDFGAIDDAVFLTSQVQPAGTGVFNTFVQVQQNGIEQGYNTDGTKQFDTKTSANFNHSVLLSQVPTVVGDGTNGTADGVVYREFLLDLNEGGGNNAFLSLDKLQIWQEESGSLTGFTPGTGFAGTHTNHLVYNLDAGGDHWVGLNGGLSHGSGQSDIAVLIPNSAFVNDGVDRFVYLYSEMGVQSGWGANSGFEEWGTSTPNGPNVATNALAISKTVSIPTQDHGTADRTGEVLSYTIHVDNVGNTTLNHLTVTDPAASGLAAVLSGGFNVGDTNHNGAFNPGESWVYTASHTVTQADLDNNGDGDGLITNTAIALTDQTGPQSATVSTPVVHTTGLAITKTPDVTSVNAAGNVINYAIAVTNTGTVSQTDPVVTDTDVNIVTPVLDFNAPILDPTKPIQAPILVGDYNIGDINQNGIQDPGETFQFANLGDTNQNGIVDPGETWVFANVGDTNQDGFQEPGETFQYYNAGDTNHNGVQDPGETFQFNVSHVASPVTSGGFNVGDTNHDGAINPGETWQYSASYTLKQADIDNGGVVDPALKHNDDATVSTDQTSLTTSASVSIVQNPHLTVAKAADVASVDAAGFVIHYTVTVGNAGNMTLTGITVSDPLVTNFAYASGDTNGNGKLDLAETWSYAGSHTVTQAEIDNGGVVDPALKITNTATADSAQTDPQTALASVLVHQNPHAALTKTAAIEGGGTEIDAAGQVIDYTLGLTNDGNMSLTHPLVSDASVSDLSQVTSSGFNVGDTNHDGKLSVGETWQYTAHHTVTQAEIDNGGVVNPALAISNTASATTDQGANASASASVPVDQDPHAALTKTASIEGGGTEIDMAGQVVDYSLALTNDGNMSLTNPLVSDPSVSDLSQVTSAGFNVGDANHDGKVSVGETWQYTAHHTVTQAEIDNGGVLDPGLTLSNTASATTDQGATASASAAVPIDQDPAMTLAKNGTVVDFNMDGVTDAGDKINYGFTVLNTGNMTLHAIGVSDVNGNVNMSGSPIASLAPGASDGTTFTGSYTILQFDIDAGFFDNEAVANSNETNATATSHVLLNPHMTLTESADAGATPAVGDPLHYTFWLKNDGSMALHGAAVSDSATAGISEVQSGGFNVGDANHDGLINIGETWTFAGDHTLTAPDLSGGVHDMAMATALGPQSQMANASTTNDWHA